MSTSIYQHLLVDQFKVLNEADEMRDGINIFSVLKNAARSYKDPKKLSQYQIQLSDYEKRNLTKVEKGLKDSPEYLQKVQETENLIEKEGISDKNLIKSLSAISVLYSLKNKTDIQQEAKIL